MPLDNLKTPESVPGMAASVGGAAGQHRAPPSSACPSPSSTLLGPCPPSPWSWAQPPPHTKSGRRHVCRQRPHRFAVWFWCHQELCRCPCVTCSLILIATSSGGIGILTD